MDTTFAEAMVDVMVSWIATYVVETEQLTQFRQWLISRPELWEVFSRVPSEEVFLHGVGAFLELARERNAERSY